MKTHLHKLSEGFIITSDEEKQVLDLVWNPDVKKKLRVSNVFMPHGDKIIAQEDKIDFSSLSIDEQKEIGFIDYGVLEFEYFQELEKRRKIAKNFTGQVAGRHPDAFGHSEMIHMNRGYIEGVQKAQELLSDKLFTLDDVVKIVHMWDNHINIHEEDKGSISTIKEFIESLSQPKSWKVEIEMEDKFALDGHTIIGREPKLTSEGKIKIITFLTLNEKYS
jgi:hypothetical protein